MNRIYRAGILTLIGFVVVACAIGGGSSNEGEQPDINGTVQAQQATIEALQSQPTSVPPTLPPVELPTQPLPPEGEETPQEEPSGAKTNFFETDFATDQGYFSLLNGMTIENGSLLMGPFDRCADFSLELDQPQGCLAICKACGEVSDYDIRFEITYEKGRTDQPIGFALRFVDENNNQMIDRADYFLGWVYNYYPGDPWVMWEHVKADYAGWHWLRKGEPHLRGKSTKPIIFRVISFNHGQNMMLYMNDTLMFKIQNEDPEKTDRIFYMKDMPNSGLIGFWVAARDVKIKIDNVTFTTDVTRPEDW